MSTRTRATQIGVGAGIATGTYTGDGAATQAIIGVGFQPRYVIIYARETRTGSGAQDLVHKADVDGVNAFFNDRNAARWRYTSDQIISLDADGFTVGDGTPIGINVLNVADDDYTYIAFA